MIQKGGGMVGIFITTRPRPLSEDDDANKGVVKEAHGATRPVVQNLLDSFPPNCPAIS